MRRAARSVLSCSSSLEPKWANSPLLLMPSVGGQAAERETFEPFDRGDLRGLGEDRVARLVAAHAAPVALGNIRFVPRALFE